MNVMFFRSGRTNDGASMNAGTRKATSSSSGHAEQSQQQKHIFNSNLNSASPPFYPSNQDIPAVGEGNLRVKPLIQDRYVADESDQPVNVKNVRNFQRAQGRGFTSLAQATVPINPLGPRANQTATQSLQRSSNQAQLTNSSDFGLSDSPRGSVKSVSTVSGKSKASTQGSGRGSFVYGGAQVIGAGGPMSLAHGDPNFPGPSALLPGRCYSSLINIFFDLVIFEPRQKELVQ